MTSLKDKIQEPNFFLTFIGADLTNSSEEEKGRWESRFLWIYPDAPQRWVQAPLIPGESFDRGPRFPWVELPVIQNALKTFVEDILKIQGGQKIQGESVIRLPNYERQLAVHDTFQIEYHQGIRKTSDGRNAPNLEVLINEFANSIDGLPSDCIKKCEECGNLFIHISKKIKIFCSPKCSFKHLSRKRREELKKHPRKYKAFLKTQKEKMRRIYEEKKRTEAGPNVVIRQNGKRPKNGKED